MSKEVKRKIILFLTGQSISLIGSALVQYAIGWYVNLTTKSGAMLAIVTVCGFLPQVIISLFGGVWADRFNRRTLIVLADGMIAVSTVILAILFSMGYEEMWLLFVISAIRSVGSGIHSPAVGAFLPDIVPPEHLMRVNGVNASIQGALFMLSPVAAGGLFGAIGLGVVFWIDAATAAVGIALLLCIPYIFTPKENTARESTFKEMSAGIRYVTGTKWLFQFLMFYLVLMFMFGPVMFLTPLMVARSFGAEVWRLTVHEVMFAVGMTIGGAMVGTIAKRLFKNQVLMVLAACVAFGVLTTVMGFSPNFVFYLSVMLLMGFVMPFMNTGSMTLLQLKVAPEVMGRVFSLVSVIGAGAMPVSMVVFGPLADIEGVSVELLLIITGILMVGISFAGLKFKEMMEAGI